MKSVFKLARSLPAEVVIELDERIRTGKVKKKQLAVVLKFIRSMIRLATMEDQLLS